MMALDPILGQLLQSLRDGGSKPTYEMDLGEARALGEAMAPLAFTTADEMKSVRDITVGQLPIRVYVPPEAGEVLTLFFHGGGFVLGSIASYDRLVRRFATLTKSVVASVGYRLAPEHPFPAAAEDALSALAWAQEALSDGFGLDLRRLAVAGDSAGGNLAAVVALEARNRAIDLVGQLLAYPATDSNVDTPSMHRFATGYFLERQEVIWFGEQYYQDEHALEDWRARPVLEDATGVGPAIIALAGYDPLRDFGVQYGEHLRAGGVRVSVRDYETLVHGFLSLGDIVPAVREATTDLFQRFAQLLSTGELPNG
ncbi:alpha/beta hydrolase [Ferrimicrobium sp.]|uniref:alpha/beta hydrolase n=2 Tax=Ferrimicrobium sp. TaxID=2926050 RepID=UPI0027E5729C|nr:alpha/beta hydrolase [Ferrimicrobium sp.]